MRPFDNDLLEMRLNGCTIKMRRMTSMTISEVDTLNSFSSNKKISDAEKAMRLMEMFFVSSSDGRTEIFKDMTLTDFTNFATEWSELQTFIDWSISE